MPYGIVLAAHQAGLLPSFCTPPSVIVHASSTMTTGPITVIPAPQTSQTPDLVTQPAATDDEFAL